jgi:hypothetical protein
MKDMIVSEHIPSEKGWAESLEPGKIRQNMPVYAAFV